MLSSVTISSGWKRWKRPAPSLPVGPSRQGGVVVYLRRHAVALLEDPLVGVDVAAVVRHVPHQGVVQPLREPDPPLAVHRRYPGIRVHEGGLGNQDGGSRPVSPDLDVALQVPGRQQPLRGRQRLGAVRVSRLLRNRTHRRQQPPRVFLRPRSLVGVHQQHVVVVSQGVRRRVVDHPDRLVLELDLVRPVDGRRVLGARRALVLFPMEDERVRGNRRQVERFRYGPPHCGTSTIRAGVAR